MMRVTRWIVATGWAALLGGVIGIRPASAMPPQLPGPEERLRVVLIDARGNRSEPLRKELNFR